MKKKGVLYLSALFILSGVMSLVIYYVKAKPQTRFGEELIATASEPLKAELQKFLLVVEKSIGKFNDEIHSSRMSDLKPDKIDTLANSLSGDNRYLKGVVLFADSLRYVFLVDSDTRITTFTSKGDSLLSWRRLDKNLKQISEWTDSYNFFLNKENRYILENAPSQDRAVKWLKIRSEIPGRKDLILQIHQLKTDDNKNIYVAFVFQTSDFSGLFLKKLSMKNPIVTVLTRNGDLFTPVATDDTVAIKKIKTAEEKLKSIFKTWSTSLNKKPQSFSFEMDNNIYWARVDTVNNNMGIEAFSLTVSKESLKDFFNKISNLFLYAGAGLILSGLILLLIVWFINRLNKAKEGELPEKHTSDEIVQLINGGESERVEFKSSLRYDYRQEKENKALEDVIIKSIAAFSNAKGGTLFIGVDDDRNILGLEKDFGTLKKNDVDYFELHLRKLIKNQFGINFSNHRLIVQFPEIENKTICVIQITTAKKPVYVKVKNKQGQMTEKFYVRNGNSSQEITSLKEMEEYIRNRFGKR